MTRGIQWIGESVWGYGTIGTESLRTCYGIVLLDGNAASVAHVGDRYHSHYSNRHSFLFRGSSDFSSVRGSSDFSSVLHQVSLLMSMSKQQASILALVESMLNSLCNPPMLAVLTGGTKKRSSSANVALKLYGALVLEFLSRQLTYNKYQLSRMISLGQVGGIEQLTPERIQRNAGNAFAPMVNKCIAEMLQPDSGQLLDCIMRVCLSHTISSINLEQAVDLFGRTSLLYNRALIPFVEKHENMIDLHDEILSAVRMVCNCKVVDLSCFRRGDTVSDSGTSMAVCDDGNLYVWDDTLGPFGHNTLSHANPVATRGFMLHTDDLRMEL